MLLNISFHLHMKSTFPKLANSLQTFTFPSQNLITAQKHHAHLLKTGTIFENSSNLVQCYCQCREFHLAHQLFDEIPTWEVVSATAIIGCFSHHNRDQDAFSLFSRFPSLHIQPNQFTFGTILRSSTSSGNLKHGKQLHSLSIKMGLNCNVFVGSALLDFYAKLGSLEEAQLAFDDTREPNVVSYTALVSGYLKKEQFDDAILLFEKMPERNVVSWNAVIGGCSQIGLNEESVHLFARMCREGVMPNQSSFPSVLSAAANIAALGLGKSFHAMALKSLAKFDVYVGNSLISLYSKCGSLEDSVLVFKTTKSKNLVSYNAMICGFAQNGKGEAALEFYRKMLVSGTKPNGVTLLGLLFACNHAGLVDEGFHYFKLTREEEPSILKAEHCACMVDLLSRSGRFSEAEKFLKELPFDPGIGFWKALLGGSQIHSRRDLTEAVARQILQLNPKDISSYVLLSNVYSSARDWERTANIRRQMKEKGMKRIPGCSWIEVTGKVHVFYNRDQRHPQTDQMHLILHSCLGSSELIYSFLKD